LSDDVLFSYKCSSLYNKSSERGISYNDPQLGIDWKIPMKEAMVSHKDSILPFFKEAEKNFLFAE